MKKNMLIVLIIMALVLVTPASAAREQPVVGDRIFIFSDGVQRFPADSPFHIKHGWTVVPGETQAIGVHDFFLEIDDEPVLNGLRYISPNPHEAYGLAIRIFNFPNGLPAGTYTFKGFWYQPCQYQYSLAECPDPNESVLSKTTTVVITFQPQPSVP